MDLWLDTENGVSTITDTAHESTLTVHYLLSTTYPSANTLNSSGCRCSRVWIISNKQPAAHRSRPQACNGILQNVDGLLLRCDFTDFPFFTCIRFLSLHAMCMD
ncbi:hypothetical protein DFH07DRAFT_368944 [Mycena maculata]|uniref:Uncharacterized protein n=1 Tax=Mycena maculata TaxID=230809 RepID=A0AAD7H8E5_9AGAR|nr:hypothetical protein DFH07DRAFT_368944 [Mycena maculata]